MFRRLIAWLNQPRCVEPDPMDLARQRREAAWIAYHDARRRKDSRALHWAERRLRRATTAMMHLELGR